MTIPLSSSAKAEMGSLDFQPCPAVIKYLVPPTEGWCRSRHSDFRHHPRAVSTALPLSWNGTREAVVGRSQFHTFQQ